MRSLLIYIYNLKFRLFKRIIPSILRKEIFFSKNQIIDLGFCKISLNLKNSIDREIYLKGFYEKEQIEYLYEISKNEKIDYFLDIGSYIGYYSLYFNNIKNIHAFEPNETNFKYLKKNIELNNKNIIAHNTACSEATSDKLIWYIDENKMGGSAIYYENDSELLQYDKKDIKFKKIKTKKLDDVIDIKNKNILIKIDVERHEFNVLLGACKKTLKENKVIMQIEIKKDLKNKIFSFLKENNFKFISSISHDHYFKNY
jgi:FkbM family methyltransferase